MMMYKEKHSILKWFREKGVDDRRRLENTGN